MSVLPHYVLDITANIYFFPQSYSLLKTKPMEFLSLLVLFCEYMRMENNCASPPPPPPAKKIKPAALLLFPFLYFRGYLVGGWEELCQGLRDGLYSLIMLSFFSDCCPLFLEWVKMFCCVSEECWLNWFHHLCTSWSLVNSLKKQIKKIEVRWYTFSKRPLFSENANVESRVKGSVLIKQT